MPGPGARPFHPGWGRPVFSRAHGKLPLVSKTLAGSGPRTGEEPCEEVRGALARAGPWARRGPEIAGFWREVGVASNQTLALKTPVKLEALFLSVSEDKLTVKAAYESSGGCETEVMQSSERDVAGKFVFPGSREVHVVDTDYERYAVLRVALRWRGRELHVFKYFTRSLDSEYERGFWRFRELTADTGLYLGARRGRCAALLKEASPRPGGP
ncbi:epididymal-specific lipocalin-8 [Talpa occidentalis]|uniref:epididymal-specific lipocalin-8 n=1 Tax=Talpa occidentalis TaxID=50954 RepID=UPI0023F9530B|nr:epididymal-specific lipocalin-8 [Talpa occidentalis]